MEIIPAFAGALAAFAFLMYFLQPRRFYIIRHGETLLNAEHIRQGEEGALSEKGREEVRLVAEYLARFRIRRIISSTYPRAKESALILRERLGAPVRYSSLLAERRNPSEIIGKHTSDPTVRRIVDEMDLAYHDDAYRYSDEESFLELRRRAKKALRMLSGTIALETCVVTHHHFLKMLVATMLYPRRLHASDFVKLSFFNTSDNAAITICEYHPWKFWNRQRGWDVISFNEHPN